jgi:hypothetical protein
MRTIVLVLLVSITCWKTTSTNPVNKDMWQTMSTDHVSEYTWHSHMMTSVKKKLSCATSRSDVRKLHHSGRIALGVSLPRNVRSLEVPKDEGPKSL